MNIFSSAIISLYMYDCCCNIADSYTKYARKNGMFREFYLLTGASVTLVLMAYIIYLGKYEGSLHKSLDAG